MYAFKLIPFRILLNVESILTNFVYLSIKDLIITIIISHPSEYGTFKKRTNWIMEHIIRVISSIHGGTHKTLTQNVHYKKILFLLLL